MCWAIERMNGFVFYTRLFVHFVRHVLSGFRRNEARVAFEASIVSYDNCIIFILEFLSASQPTNLFVPRIGVGVVRRAVSLIIKALSGRSRVVCPIEIMYPKIICHQSGATTRNDRWGGIDGREIETHKPLMCAPLTYSRTLGELFIMLSPPCVYIYMSNLSLV